MKIWLFGLIVAMAMVLAACAPAAAPAEETTPAPAEETTPPAEETTPAPAEKFTIIVMEKIIGIDYFAATEQGMKEAVEELGNIEWEVTGPLEADPAPQVEMLDGLIARHPDALIVSAADADALVPVLQRAMDAGIVVVTYDADVRPEGRDYFVNQASFEVVGKGAADEIALEAGEDAKYAIVSTTATAPNQTRWVEEMRKAQEELYPNMKFLDLRFGQDVPEETRKQTEDLIHAYPEMNAVFVPTASGCPGAADAVEATGSVGKVNVVCLATPNTMRDFIKRGTVQAILLWNPVDLGYLAMYATHAVLVGDLTSEDPTFEAGRLGPYTADETNEILLGGLFRFDASNIDQFRF